MLSGFRPTLRWTPSDDPSGATYTLQIDANRDFSNPSLLKQDLVTPSYTLTGEEGLSRGKYYWRVKVTDGASNDGPWSELFVVKSGVLPLWIFPVLGVLGVLAAAGVVYVIVYRRRQRRLQPVFFPSPVMDKPTVTTALPSGRQRTLGAPPRLALPSPSRRGRSLSVEEEAGLKRMLDFVRSIPLLPISTDLVWLEEFIAATEGAGSDVYEDALMGRLPVRYQPAWTRHPAYTDLQRLLQGQPFLQGLNEYTTAVDGCAAEALVVLREVYENLAAALPPQTPKGQRWRLTLAVGQDALAWFQGTFLQEPSARDYVLKSPPGPAEVNAISLFGAEGTPLRTLLVEGLTEADATLYRNVHIQCRVRYRDNEQAGLLAARMTQVNVLREQLLQAIAQLGQAR